MDGDCTQSATVNTTTEIIPTKATLEQPVAEGSQRYRLFLIEPKRDFGPHGYLSDGKVIKEGWVVTDGMCNVMPGATWFSTVNEAEHAIDVLIAVRGSAEMFWEIMQPWKYTPGQKMGGLGCDGHHSKGRHWARFEHGVCVEVGITEPAAGGVTV